MRPGWAGAAVGAIVLALVAIFVWAAMRMPQPEAAGRASSHIAGRIELGADASTSSPLPPDAMVVVYAYALDGPRLPLAVFRRPAGAVPLDFKLDDTLAANPAYRLSQATQLIVGARLGHGDGVEAQAGDWQAAPQAVLPGAQALRVVLQPPRMRP